MEAVDVADFDLHHHQAVEALRAKGPIAWSAALEAWVVTSRELASAVMRDATTFTVDDPRFSTAQVVGPSMLSLDGAEHARHRNPFAEPLRPAEATARHGARIDAMARAIVGAVRPAGAAELRREIAGPLAVAVASSVLGVDHVPPAALLAWYDLIVSAVGAVSDGGVVPAVAADAFAQLVHAIEQAMRHDDTLVAVAGRSLSAAEVVSNSAVFLFGGIETSEGMTANVLHHLLADPVQRQMVAADRRLVDAAVEESLRLEPAAARVDRYATADVRVGGVQVRRGDFVVVSLAGANRDPDVYPDPDRFDVRRSNVRSQVAFAHGPHACIGAQLARLQTRAALSAVLDMLPGIELVEPVEVRGAIFRKPLALRAAWTLS